MRIEKRDGGWRLLRNGEPYFVKGAVVGPGGSLDMLKQAGANSLRTHAGMLDEAQRRGFTALAGLPLGNPRHGFDYADTNKVEQQFNKARDLVRKYRDHPALLFWNLGNEPEINTTAEQRAPVWREANRLAEMVKREDPNHPVMIVIGGQYADMLHELNDHCPALDLVGLNSYAQMLKLPEEVAAQGWTRPYLVTEFGPRGHWQVPKTAWKMPIEDDAAAKADFYRRAYEHSVAGQPACLGSYVFYWAHKQEKTHTWYGMFLPDGSRTPAIDTMTLLWSGRWPTNRCPALGPEKLRVMRADGHAPEKPGVFTASEKLGCVVDVTDPDGDPLRVTWELRPDVADNPNVGGDWEPSVEPLPGVTLATSDDGRRAEIQLPAKPGKYRLFVYAHDGRGNATTANLPLLAEEHTNKVAQESIAFPTDEAVLDLRRDFAAKGDGVADDTEALQKGIEASCRGKGKQSGILFIPNGAYRVTRTLVVSSAVGPWVYGESRDGVVIRLADGITDTNCTAVLRTHPHEKGKTSADWFMRNFRNLTIDVGNNPGVDGIRWYGNNTGILKNIRVTGRGKIGINSGFLDQSGPNLIQDAVIEGFDTGILSQWIWGETLSRITIRNCRSNGVIISANAVGIEDLTVENTPVAIRNEVPNNWGHWGGVIALVGGRFTGGSPEQPAIVNQSVLYARDVKTSGFKMALQSSAKGGDVSGPDIGEYVFDPVKHLFDSPTHALGLPIKPEPDFPWENDPARWICANDYGATPGDNQDDTAAIQKVIDAAAATGKTTVFFRGVGGGDPNWYNLNGEVRVHGSVRHILALGFGRILGNKGTGKFVVSDDSAPLVKFQHLQAFGGGPATVENRSASRTMIVESCDLRILGTGRGDIFVTDCSSHVDLRQAGQKCWARQLNPEGTSDSGLVQNAGADLWVLGAKFEGAGVRFRTSAGGRTEVLGMFLYDPGNLKETDTRPIFDIDNASFSVAGLREINFGGHTYISKVREKRGGETRTLDKKNEGGWIGWSLFSGWKGPKR